LIRRIGNDNVSIQFLNECLSGATKRKNGTVEVKFFTCECDVGSFMTDDPQKIGMVVWMDYKQFRDVQAQWKRENTEAVGGGAQESA
jgi:hypothetical protein